MKYSLDKYRFITHDNEVIAISTYAGKTVKGKAKCDPRDGFNEDTGKQLAAARCNAKIADKREARARKKLVAAQAQLDAARKHYEKMAAYFNDSKKDASVAHGEVETLEKSL